MTQSAHEQAIIWAIEHCVSMTDRELEAAYGRNTILGNGDICDIYLAEMDRRYKADQLENNLAEVLHEDVQH